MVEAHGYVVSAESAHREEQTELTSTCRQCGTTHAMRREQSIWITHLGLAIAQCSDAVLQAYAHK